MSIAAGVFMTRASAKSSSLGGDVATQITSKPYALFFASIFLFFLGLTGKTWFWDGTGLPSVPFLIFAAAIFIAGFQVLINADVQSQLGQ